MLRPTEGLSSFIDYLIPYLSSAALQVTNKMLLPKIAH